MTAHWFWDFAIRGRAPGTLRIFWLAYSRPIKQGTKLSAGIILVTWMLYSGTTWVFGQYPDLPPASSIVHINSKRIEQLESQIRELSRKQETIYASVTTLERFHADSQALKLEARLVSLEERSAMILATLERQNNFLLGIMATAVGLILRWMVGVVDEWRRQKTAGKP